MTVVQAKNISFRYHEADIFTDLSFQVNKGELFCLFGPNGCGKTTLLECLLGLLTPREGEVIINGHLIHQTTPTIAGRNIAYVPQAHQSSFPYSVLEIVLMGRAPYIGLYESPSQRDMDMAQESLWELGLETMKDRDYTTLSGGELQLVMVARALTQQTPIIIMDEPTAHLDFKHELIILETIVKLLKKGKSILMTTHVPNHIYYLEYQGIPVNVALMNQKQFVAVGTPSDLLTEENMEETYSIKSKTISLNGEEETKGRLRQIVPLRTIKLGEKQREKKKREENLEE